MEATTRENTEMVWLTDAVNTFEPSNDIDKNAMSSENEWFQMGVPLSSSK